MRERPFSTKIDRKVLIFNILKWVGGRIVRQFLEKWPLLPHLKQVTSCMLTVFIRGSCGGLGADVLMLMSVQQASAI